MITKATLPSDTLLLESTTNTSLDEAAMASTVPGLWKESARKLFHMIGLLVPAVYFFTSRRLAIQILVPLTATSVLLDLVRHRHGKTGDIFTEIFGSILRAHERDREAKNLNGLTWFLIGVTVATIVFPKDITIISVTVSTFADAAAALIGMRFGTRRFKGKSLEGSAAFFVVAVIVIALISKTGDHWSEYIIGVIAAMIGTVVEFVAVDAVADNCTVPLSIALSMWSLHRWVFRRIDIIFGL